MGNNCSTPSQTQTEAQIAADLERVRRQKMPKLTLRVQTLDSADNEVSAAVQGWEMVAESLNRELCAQWGAGVVSRILHGGQELRRVRWEETGVEAGAVVRVEWAPNTLGSKKEGLSKMIKEKGDAFIDEMWKIYVAWPCPLDGVAHVQRYNRKKALKGEWCDSGKDTWPLNWSGDGSVEALLQECGWGEDVTGSLQNALFGGEAQSVYHVHPNCKEDQCCWPDLQSVFRFIIADGEPWTEELNGEYPPLDGRRATLRNKITKDQIKDVLEGDFRMYCMPPEESGQSAFSYGVVIKDVDVEAGTFGGHSATEGVYTIDEGKLLFDDKTGRLNVSYTEVWSNGARDALSARVKSNSKYQCESTSGYEQKASQAKNVPLSEEAPPGIKKYHDNSM